MRRGSSPQAGEGWYKNPEAYYNSPVVHTVVLRGLLSGPVYHYQVANDGRVFSFQMPPASTPLLLGLTADLGQTAVSAASVAALRAMQPDVVLLSGDLSYADGCVCGWHCPWRVLISDRSVGAMCRLIGPTDRP